MNINQNAEQNLLKSCPKVEFSSVWCRPQKGYLWTCSITLSDLALQHRLIMLILA